MPRVSIDDALTVWRAREIHRVQSALQGFVILFFVMEFLMYCAVGYWWLGVAAIALQWAFVRCLIRALRWLRCQAWAWWDGYHMRHALRQRGRAL